MRRPVWLAPLFFSAAVHGAVLSGAAFSGGGPTAGSPDPPVLLATLMPSNSIGDVAAPPAAAKTVLPAVGLPVQAPERPPEERMRSKHPHPPAFAVKAEKKDMLHPVPENVPLMPGPAAPNGVEPAMAVPRQPDHDGKNGEKHYRSGGAGGGANRGGITGGGASMPGGALGPGGAPGQGGAPGTAASQPASILILPKPAYPAASRRRGQEGAVLVSVEIGIDGRPGATTVIRSSGHPRLDEAARRACTRAVFTPAMRSGKPVASDLRVAFRFELEGEDETDGD